MEEKNMALLGFIASATEYLETHMGEEYKNLEELSDIDLSAIKKELANNLGNSFDRSDKNARRLLSAGKTAFQDYINNKNTPKLIDEFDEIFKVDFRKANKEKDELITNNLMRLLQGKNAVDDEIDEFARAIANNREELISSKFSIKPAEAAGIDDIFDEIVMNENGPVEPAETETLEEEIEENVESELVEAEEIDETIIEEETQEVNEEIPVTDEEIFDTFEVEEDIMESSVHVSDDEIFETIEIEEEPEVEEIIEVAEPEVEETILAEEPQEEAVENETVDDVYEEPILNPASEQVTFEDDYQKQVEKATDDYIARLMKDLNGSNITDKIEENKQKEKEENRIYDDIKDVYPYLTDGFVRRVYELRDSFEQEYKEGIKVILLQRLKFEDIDGLRKFVEVVMQHEYLVNVDEDKMIVDVFKEHINSEGLILSEIFAIANQGRLLTGDYEGYRVLINEEQEG